MSTVKSITCVLDGVDLVGECATCGPPREERSYFREFTMTSLQSNVIEVARKGRARNVTLISIPDESCMVKEDKKGSEKGGLLKCANGEISNK